MEQRISLVTLGVRDVAASRAFYEALAWTGQTVGDPGDETVFFQTGGLAVVLWSRAKLADDAGVGDEGAAYSGIALAQNVHTREEVDEVLASAAAAGATITQQAAETFYGGYAGYFADPDGHLWEIAHNPGFTLRADGTLELPEFGD
jgi:predicted lactoylglutathione lyase